MIIRVLSEVKFREDEYDVIKDIVTRIQGFPSFTQLAKRERRLLIQGALHCLSSTAKPRNVHPLGATSNQKLKTCCWNQRHEFTTRSWIYPICRSDSCITPLTCDAFSPKSPAFGFKKASSKFQISSSSRDQPQSIPSVEPSSQELSHKAALQVFVFNDLIVLATPITRMTSNKCQNWRLLEKTLASPGY